MKRIGRSLNKTLKTAWCVLFFTVLPILTDAQDRVEMGSTPPVIHVAAVVKPRHIRVGEKAQLKLTLSGDTSLKHIKAPKFNFLPAFLAAPIDSETVPQLKSDKIAVSMAWVYELIPQAIGDFRLSDIRFDYHGDSYFANPGSIRVSGSDTYQETLTGGVHQVEAEVDTAEPYLNAPFTYTFRYLYTTVLPTRETPTPRLPTFRDFFVEQLQKLPLYTRDMRGKTFWVEEHTQTLYPKKTGQIRLEPAELLLPLPKGRTTLKTKPLTLSVQPIPETGKPAHFNGAIGTYQISAELERSWVETGNAITLSVRISGRGNIQTVTPPTLPTIPGTMVSGPTLTDAGITPTSRTYIYTLTPVQAGTLRIPAIAYAYFDPDRATYATSQTTPMPLSVRPNPNDPTDIDTEDGSWKIWGALLLAILLIGVLIAGFFWYRAGFQIPTRVSPKIPIGTDSPNTGEIQDSNTQRSAAAPATPRSQAQEALSALAYVDTTPTATIFANTLAQTLYQYLEQTLALSQRNVAAVRQVAAQTQIPESTLEELAEVLTKCEYHRFAPVPLSADERDTLIARTETIIDHIENLQNAYTQ